MDSCMHNPFEQCSHECPKCEKRDKPEPDVDLLRDLEREDKLYE